jgi:large subunit ribosomal protein L10
MAKVELKQPIVDEIKGVIDGAQSVITVKYLGINVDQDTKLRKELRENGVIYKVYKNTLIKRAIAGTEFAGLEPDLEGPTAIAVSRTDATAPARIVAKYIKTVKALELKGGVVEGTYYDAQQMVAISEIPGREELLSRLLGSLQSPIANFARVLNQIAEKDGEGAAPAAEAAAAE